MALLGWATAGSSSVSGPSKVYQSLPYKGWKEISAWLEEAIDSIGVELDYRDLKFFRSSARANLLDPTYAPPSTDQADAFIANATTAPSSAVSRASMLDLLLYVTLGYYPADTNLSVAIKQKLAQVGWSALRRKGTRLQMLNIASKVSFGPAVGWTVPPFNFSIILPDGTPSPGQGAWTPPNASTPSVNRPWALQAIRKILSNGIAPDWSNIGIGFSQFRAGYSAAGETVFPIGSRINILTHEHFDSWSVGVPVGWTKLGAGTLTQSTTAAQINWEFAGNAAVFDLTAASAGTLIGLAQATAAVNNQAKHHIQIDYAYSNTQGVSTLLATIVDNNRDGNAYYWNPTTASWSTAVYNIPLPVSALRTRFSTDVTMQATSPTTTTFGTAAVTVSVFAKSDGTSTTKTTYTLYRAGVYESFDLAGETAALGERTLWTPLVDAPGWTTAARSSGGVLLEMANPQRTAYRLVSAATAAHFPYHPALNGFAYRSMGNWTNLLKGSRAFSSDWALTNAIRFLNNQLSPIAGETTPTATTIDSTAYGAAITQSSIATPTSKSYVGGIWMKKLVADTGAQNGSLTLTVGSSAVIGTSTTFTGVLISGCQITTASGHSYTVASIADDTHFTIAGAASATEIATSWTVCDFVLQLITNLNVYSVAVTLPQADGWQHVPFRQTFGAADTSLAMSIKFVTKPTTSGVALGASYLYDVTGTPGVLYPPVVVSPIGSTAVTGASTCAAITASQGVNVQHPLTLRTQASVVRGQIAVTVVPTFDATSMPNGVIFDLAQAATQNRVVLRVNGGILELRRWDNASAFYLTKLTLVANNPAAFQMVWQRDVPIVVRSTWDSTGSQLSANGSTAQFTATPGGWTPSDAAVATCTIGSDLAGATPFDGQISALEIDQIGAAST